MKHDMKTLISELTVIEKIELLDCLYHELSGHGTDGDTELAHINTREASVLKALGGSGTVNEITGLRQYGKGSPPPPPPSATSMTQEIPAEIKPYITDILAKSQAIQEQRTEEGYRPYTGPQLADFTPEQRQAFEQASGLQGLTGTYQDRASELTASSAMAPTGEQLQQYMNPYMQNVVDIQQREAQRQADVAGQQLSAQAVGAGGFGGSRQAILEAESSRNLQTQLGDIQAKGLMSSYEDAQARLAAQKQREFSAGNQFSQLGQSALQGNLAEQQALQQAGGMQQAQQQAAFDIAKGQFEAEKTFPEQTLQQYSSLIRGYAMPPSTTTTMQTPAPSTLQQLAGLGTAAYGGGKAFGLFKEGGKVGDGRGIASIIVKRNKGGKVIKMQAGGLTQMQILRQMSAEDLMKAKKDANFQTEYSPVLIDQVLEEKGISFESPLGRGIGAMGKGIEATVKSIPESYMTFVGRPFSSLMSGIGSAAKWAVPPTASGPGLEMEPKLDEATLRRLNQGEDLDNEPYPSMDTPTAVSVNLNSVGGSPAITSEDARRRVAEIEANQARQSSGNAPSGVTINLDTATAEEPTASTGISESPFADRMQMAVDMRNEARQGLADLAEKQKVATEKGKEGIEQQKWLEVANLGLNILAQPGGQTFLQAIGKGAKEAGTIQNLSKLADKEQQIAKGILSIDEKKLMRDYGFTKDDVDNYLKSATLDLKGRELDIDADYKKGLITAKEADDQRKNLQIQIDTMQKALVKPPSEKDWAKLRRDVKKSITPNAFNISDPKKVARLEDLKNDGMFLRNYYDTQRVLSRTPVRDKSGKVRYLTPEEINIGLYNKLIKPKL